MRRPFSVRFSSAAPDDMLRVRVEFASLPTAAMSERAQVAGQHFANLANAGALCGDAVAPRTSGIDDAQFAVAPMHVDWLYTGVRIDPLSVFIALNMLHSFHEKTGKLRGVHVSWNALRDADNPAALAFPKIAAPLPFAFSYDQDAAAFDIVLDFAQPQDEKSLYDINETLGHWLCAVDAGGYGDENTLPHLNRVRFESDEPCLLDSGSLVWSIQRFSSTSYALAGMVNVVSKIHHTQAAIKLLDISE